MSSSIPLTQAVTSGDESAVRALLAAGADVNETNNGGQTALILAVIFGHTHLIRLLIQAGANPHLRDNLGLNAIEWAQRRGLTEAFSVLTNTSNIEASPTRIVVNIEEPAEPSVAPAPPVEKEERETGSVDDKSRRWLAGLKQRLDEMEVRRLNRNEPPPERRTAATQETSIIEKVTSLLPATTVEPVTKKEKTTGRIITPPPTTPTGKRKRCPQCNAIYNSDLVSYCAHHIVPLVDDDLPVISEPSRTTPLFWMILVITLSGSIVIGSLITAYVYNSNRAAAVNAAAPQPSFQKGLPELSAELAGKAVSLPEAQCPVSGAEPVSGTVTVRVMVERNGQVNWARGAGGDWLMRGAATDAAMKSTFSPEKLRGRETEGTITYTFKP